MSVPIEKKVGAALGRLLAAAGLEAATLARRLGLAPADLTGLVSGRDPLDLARLQRVLTALGKTPSDFFADVYAAPDDGFAAPAGTAAAPAPPAERLLEREEVERLVGDLQASIRTLVRLIETDGVPVGSGSHDLTP
jgi:transcriptional regulator with XRE-family HTH domain